MDLVEGGSGNHDVETLPEQVLDRAPAQGAERDPGQAPVPDGALEVARTIVHRGSLRDEEADGLVLDAAGRVQEDGG